MTLLDPAADLDLERCLAAFEAAHAQTPTVDLAAFLPARTHPAYLDILCELVRVDLEFAWDAGEARSVTSYRRRFPELFDSPRHLRDVEREEQRLRRAASTPTTPAAATPPALGTVVAGFRLERELGRGSFARVYLARQGDLADRPVVVKVSHRFPGESRTLARLQHANIVPVYSVHLHTGLHVTCMPFLGATTLADLLRELHAVQQFPTSARWVASTLTERSAHTLGGLTERTLTPTPPAIRTRYDQASYVELVLWLGAELADGLAHAHARGILHRDIKPANVLLTDEGRPMLLDFNLASDAADPRTTDTTGGTLRYMAPEQRAGLDDPTIRPDARSDVFALGLVLFELLTGTLPAEPGAPLRTFCPAAPRAVAAILRKALDPDPARRYQSAADLREDLQRQLDHRPLRFAPDRSLPERLAKWSRRHPRLASWTTGAIVALVLLGAVVAGFLVRQRQFDEIAADQRVARLDQTRAEVRALVSPGAAQAELLTACRQCDAALAASTAEPRERPGVAAVSYYRARAAHLLAARAGDPNQRRHLRDEAFAAHERAWASVATPSVELRLQRAALLHALGRSNEAEELLRGLHAPDAALGPVARARAALPALIAAGATEAGRWDYWLHLGKHYHRAGDLPAARSACAVAAELAPRSPWPHYHAGLVALDAKDHTAAAAAFTAVLARTQDVPEAYLNRALARLAGEDLRGACADLTAIETEAPRLPRLLFIRAEVRRRAGDLAGAARDRAAGLALEPTDAAAWNARGEVRLTLTPPNAVGALADFRQAVTVDADFRPGYENQAAVLDGHLHRPAEALAILDATIERFPDYVLARAGRAVLRARLGQVAAARADAETVLAGQPNALLCYQAGCVYLLTSTGQPDRDRGLSLLRRALRLDPTWAKAMPTDPDLKSVRDSATFRALIEAANELARDQIP